MKGSDSDWNDIVSLNSCIVSMFPKQYFIQLLESLHEESENRYHVNIDSEDEERTVDSNVRMYLIVYYKQPM